MYKAHSYSHAVPDLKVLENLYGKIELKDYLDTDYFKTFAYEGF